MIDEMYELFMKNIPDYEGKICVPISGGLDSRVLAGLISKKRKIDLSYCQYELKYPVKELKDIKNVGYARQIADVCCVGRFESIYVNDYTEDDMFVINVTDDLSYMKRKINRTLHQYPLKVTEVERYYQEEYTRKYLVLQYLESEIRDFTQEQLYKKYRYLTVHINFFDNFKNLSH